MKCCSKCGVEKSLAEFYKDRTSSTGYNFRCKVCSKIAIKRWQHNNKELVREMMLKTHSSIPPSVYQIKCLVNGKSYIGQSTRPYKRILSEHLVIHKNFNKKHLISSPTLQADLKLYGRNNFKYEILESCSPELLLERESYYIQTLKQWWSPRSKGRSPCVFFSHRFFKTLFPFLTGLRGSINRVRMIDVIK